MDAGDRVTYDDNAGTVRKVVASTSVGPQLCVVDWDNGSTTSVWRSDLKPEGGA